MIFNFEDSDINTVAIGWASFIGVFLVIFYLTGLVLAYWVYKDATKRKMDYTKSWFLIVLLTSIVGFLLYLLIRE